MYKNRIIELSKLSSRVGSKLEDPLMAQQEDLDATQKQFSESVERIERRLRGIESITQKIIILKDSFKKAKSNKQSNEKTSEMQDAVNTNNDHISKLNAQLKNLNRIIQQFGANENATTSAQYKQMVARRNILKSQAMTALQQSRVAQDDFKTLGKNTMKRHINVIDKDLTQQQKQQIIQNPQKIQQLLAQKLNNQASTNLVNAVADIQSKYKDILNLQKTINQCFQLMQDIAILVDYQGQQINRIQIQIDDAANYVTHGTGKLKQAKGHHKSANKKICYLILLVMILIAAIVVPIIFTKVV